MNSAGIYIHIPFCRQKCPYCDFYSVAADDAAIDSYAAALLRAIDRAPEKIVADTIYFGGGTPVLMGAKRLGNILAAAAARFGLPNDAEITLEANPCAVTPELLRNLVAAGFNRISFGVQSMNDATLRMLERAHTAAQAAEALEWAAAAGFSHCSADLMLAVPGQTVDEIERSVKTLTALGVNHLSAYLLKIEAGTPFAARYADPQDDFAADCYLAAVAACERNGLKQYEISNFARNDAAQSRHNLKYWQGDDYLGIGPAAHSLLRGRRFYFPRSLAGFCAADHPWTLAVSDGEGGGEDERLMLGLRLTRGICPADFSPEIQQTILRQAPALARAGLAGWQEGRLCLTPRGFLVSNAVIAALLG